MRRARIINRPTTPPAQPHCGACHLTLAYLERTRDTYECSRIECPQRRGYTAQPCDKPREATP